MLFASLFFLGAIDEKAKTAPRSYVVSIEKISQKPFFPLAYEKIKDTIYVLGDSYVEVCLDSQLAVVTLRSGDQYEYKISSGNPNISKGMETTSGVFTVQSKSPKAISKQFNDAELFHWVGFKGNIGFHGLAGNGYYGHLGKRPSSHGCLRISREDGKELYGKVKLGTPVMVYRGEPARVFAFADWQSYANSNSILISKDARQVNNTLNKRLEHLYNGKAHIYNHSKVFLDGSTVTKNSNIEAGLSSKIAPKQELPLYEIEFATTLSDKLRVKSFVADTFHIAEKSQK